MREWMAMYRCHRLMQDGISQGMGLPTEKSASAELDELWAVTRMPQEEIAEEVAELSREEQEDFLRLFIGVPFPPSDATIRAMLDGIDTNFTPDDPDEEAMTDMLMASPSGQFFMRVWWPCWILYREYPPRLLRSARLGNLDSLDRLLRLDKRAIADP